MQYGLLISSFTFTEIMCVKLLTRSKLSKLPSVSHIRKRQVAYGGRREEGEEEEVEDIE